MTIKAGFSKICINPPLGAPISDYYMPRFTKGILDDIYVSLGVSPTNCNLSIM